MTRLRASRETRPLVVPLSGPSELSVPLQNLPGLTGVASSVNSSMTRCRI